MPALQSMQLQLALAGGLLQLLAGQVAVSSIHDMCTSFGNCSSPRQRTVTWPAVCSCCSQSATQSFNATSSALCPRSLASCRSAACILDNVRTRAILSAGTSHQPSSMPDRCAARKMSSSRLSQSSWRCIILMIYQHVNSMIWASYVMMTQQQADCNQLLMQKPGYEVPLDELKWTFVEQQDAC